MFINSSKKKSLEGNMGKGKGTLLKGGERTLYLFFQPGGEEREGVNLGEIFSSYLEEE